MSEEPFYYNRFRFPGRRVKFEPKDGVQYLQRKGPSTVVPRNNYDHTSFFIPYGLEWDAKKVKDLVQSIEVKFSDPNHAMNYGRRLHRHSMFVSEAVQDCLDEFCKGCPSPQNEEEEELQRKEDKTYRPRAYVHAALLPRALPPSMCRPTHPYKSRASGDILDNSTGRHRFALAPDALID
ncbi:hypothetical protein NLJ89_g11547 [Agrocybe chaxingu]|uniref:Uncharacterized protein n=1 Tax=Agrocybe chaxingu TaxID=84603 RepID=A0A9W8MPX1_9AGAR|nr:hypothetical protein NLJ89_g11547 [Agrocybe chaxingu]